MSRILLIEPDRVLAQTYCQALQADGHQVTPCASAQAAILSADDQQPDIVIIELQLVEHSGIEFMYEFRSYPEWQAIPVIAQTMVPMSEFTNQQVVMRQLGIHSYLYKPQTSLRQLLNCVSMLTPVSHETATD